MLCDNDDDDCKLVFVLMLLMLLLLFDVVNNSDYIQMRNTYKLNAWKENEDTFCKFVLHPDNHVWSKYQMR